jgi:flagellar protein FlgJ
MPDFPPAAPPPPRKPSTAAPAGRLDPRARPRPAADDARLDSACREMEALFIHHLLGEMRKSVEKTGLFDGGRAEEIMTGLMDAELAKSMAAAGGLGLGRVLYDQLARTASGTGSAAPPPAGPPAGSSGRKP